MKNKIQYSLLVCLMGFVYLTQAQISTKGIDLTYLQQLIKKNPKSIPSNYENNGSRPPQTKVAYLKAGSDTFHVNFIDILSAGELRILSDTLHNSNYPLTILHKDVFSNYTELLLEYDLLTYKYTELEKTADTLQALQKREIKELKNIIALEKEKANIIRESRAEIMSQVDFLNKELDLAIKVQTKSRRRNFGKNFFTGAIGGAIGLAVGVLLMEFAR